MVTIEKRIHLFPSRTQKLSSSSPIVLGSQGPGRVGRSQLEKNHRVYILWFFSAINYIKDKKENSALVKI